MRYDAMRHAILPGSVLVFAILASVWTAESLAADPDFLLLRDYQFIPSHSIVKRTGGFAGVDDTFPIVGRFGLETGFRGGGIVPLTDAAPTVEYAKFVDVKATLVNLRSASPLPLPGLDLDQTLNLSGLDGV